MLGLLAAAGLSFSLAGCLSGGTTYGTGVPVGKQTITDVTGIVRFSNKKASIDYEPRGALVTPPKDAALPPPGDNAKVASVADWPNDPDEAAKAEKARRKKEKITYVDGIPQNGTKYKLAPGVLPTPTTTLASKDEPYVYDAKAAKERAKIMADAKAAQGVARDANGNVIRTSLTEPPVTYREPDPTAPTVFEDVKKKKRRFHWPWQRD
ncbi:MAG TPA: hypothetical protein VFB16_04980 [Bauldia sp.]|nr:hypothetical protein [Bauldia sp.]